MRSPTAVQSVLSPVMRSCSFHRRGIRRLDKGEDRLVAPDARLHKREDSVGTEIRVDGRGVKIKGVQFAVPDFYAAQIRLAVSRRRGADVVPLDVCDYVEPFRPAVVRRLFQRLNAGVSQQFIVGRLGFDRGDDVAEGVDQAAVEFKIRVGGRLKRFAFFRRDAFFIM